MTNQAKYTPGPWEVFSLDDGLYSIVHNGPILYVKDNGNGPENTEANAALIAAAPELLEALNRLLDCPALNLDNLEVEDYDACDQARAAIAKAEGKS